MIKIAFYSPHLSERGTETALYDFAHFNEKILGNKSIIIYDPKCSKNHLSAVEKFKKRFDVFHVNGPAYDFGWNSEVAVPLIDKILLEQKCDILYLQKGGRNEGVYSRVCKNIILCCSSHYEPHGEAYLYVSKWLSETFSNGQAPYIPIIIDVPKGLGNLRGELSIPDNAIVFGRTGGMDTWDIPWANEAINKALSYRQDLYFVFQNTPKIFNHDRVKYIKTTADSNFKSQFIETCDAMIHCRRAGESFGQSCAEFSFMNKPVVTWSGSRERSHIDILGDKGIYYRDENGLFNILMSFVPNNSLDWNCYKQHTPEIAMEHFSKIIQQVMEER